MGKRKGKGRRRQPARHPVPPARLKAAQPQPDEAGDRTEHHLVDGWALTPQILVRQARSADMQAVQELAALAGVDLEAEVVEAVRDDVAGAAVRTGLRSGQDGFQRQMVEQFFGHQRGDQRVPFLHATLVLVAAHAEQGIVGAIVAYPPIAVIRQLLEHSKRTGVDPMQILLMGAVAITRVRALAVAQNMRGQGVGAALLQRCRLLYAHCGYVMVYGQMPTTPGLDEFYRRQGFTVLEVGAGFDPWVVFGLHAEIRPEPDERIFICDQPRQSRRRSRPTPVPPRAARRSMNSDRYDPGTLALHDAHLQALLQQAPGEVLAVQFPTLLWVKLAEGRRANACVDACVQLCHAYEQLGIAAHMVPVGVVVEDASGELNEYATTRPRWESETVFVGHIVLVLPELGKLVDPTIEQIPAVRALGKGPLVDRLTPEAVDILIHGKATFGVPRDDLLIGYVPVEPDCRGVLTDAPLLINNAERYRRAGVNLATLVLESFRDVVPGVVDRLRQVPNPRIHALLDAIGDAPMQPDADGDMRITLRGGAAPCAWMRFPYPPPARTRREPGGACADVRGSVRRRPGRMRL